jgi:hypothetical protein
VWRPPGGPGDRKLNLFPIFAASPGNVAPRYAIIRWPGGEAQQPWQVCGACYREPPVV